MICADSMHSKRKVSEKYPQLNKTMIQELYGLNVKGLKQSMWDVRKSLPDMFRSMKRDFDNQYKDLNSINLTKFYKDTTPVYFMAECEMDTIDCTENWVMKETSHGNCLWLNTTEVYKIKLKSMEDKNKRRIKRSFSFGDISYGERFKSNVARILERFESLPDANRINNLNLIIGYNTSDETFGWNGFNNALQLYYLDSDEIYLGNEHKVVLLPTLNPSVTFIQRVTKLLGEPFTNCNPKPNYTKQTCQVHAYMAKVLDKCGCYPR